MFSLFIWNILYEKLRRTHIFMYSRNKIWPNYIKRKKNRSLSDDSCVLSSSPHKYFTVLPSISAHYKFDSPKKTLVPAFREILQSAAPAFDASHGRNNRGSNEWRGNDIRLRVNLRLTARSGTRFPPLPRDSIDKNCSCLDALRISWLIILSLEDQRNFRMIEKITR